MRLPRGPRGEILPPPTYTAARQAKATADSRAEQDARKALRAALTRYRNKRGTDELISALKIELEALGEQPKLLHSLAPTFDAKGQSSILNIAPVASPGAKQAS
ncbi:hypothetical protein [Aureimonas sp. D3]|uniref:hypothetical protein n=1 Tax=Aureimonas sp. D3 TaxID=1638164 RepID=UPI000780411C|nr:hypothetical protein [Aureimonas sp. D3]